MRKQDLRIGNTIYFGGQIDSVTEISHNHIRTKNNGWLPIEGVKGVQSTEEWLERLGFIKQYHELSSESFYHKNEELFGFDYEDVGMFPRVLRHVWDGSYTGSPCAYVHQLQNLYFALTGEELEIKQ